MYFLELKSEHPLHTHRLSTVVEGFKDWNVPESLDYLLKNAGFAQDVIDRENITGLTPSPTRGSRSDRSGTQGDRLFLSYLIILNSCVSGNYTIRPWMMADVLTG